MGMGKTLVVLSLVLSHTPQRRKEIEREEREEREWSRREVFPPNEGARGWGGKVVGLMRLIVCKEREKRREKMREGERKRKREEEEDGRREGQTRGRYIRIRFGLGDDCGDKKEREEKEKERGYWEAHGDSDLFDDIDDVSTEEEKGEKEIAEEKGEEVRREKLNFKCFCGEGVPEGGEFFWISLASILSFFSLSKFPFLFCHLNILPIDDLMLIRCCQCQRWQHTKCVSPPLYTHPLSHSLTHSPLCLSLFVSQIISSLFLSLLLFFSLFLSYSSSHFLSPSLPLLSPYLSFLREAENIRRLSLSHVSERIRD